jgi:hypothetical protein
MEVVRGYPLDRLLGREGTPKPRMHISTRGRTPLAIRPDRTRERC